MDLLETRVRITADDQASDKIQNVSNNALGGLKDKALAVGKAFAGLWAVKKVADFGRAAFDAYTQFEQLSGGAAKIFDEIDQSKILNDATGAWKNLNMSANEYLGAINQTGAMFAQTMGDEKGYDTAKKGMQAISDYATGTGRNINELNTKFSMITRAASSYQSIADQFAGILPATSADFLKQAQAAGFLSSQYKKLTDVPVAEYQAAVADMLEKGVADLGLAGNTAKEALGTIEGSMLATKAAWQNLITEIGKPDADIGARISDMMTALFGNEQGGGLVANVTNEVLTITGNVANGIGNIIGEAANSLVTNGPTMVKSAMDSIGSAIDEGIAALDGITANFDLTKTLFGSGEKGDDGGIVGSIESTLSNIGSTLEKEWPKLSQKFGGLFGSLGGFILKAAPDIQNAALNLFGTIGDAVYGALPNIARAIPGLVSGIGSWLVENGPLILNAAGEMLSNIGTAITTHAPQWVASMGQAIGILVGSIIKGAGDMLNAGVQLVKGLLDGSTQEGQAVREWFAKLPDTILTALGDVGSFLLDTGKALIDGLMKGIEEVAPDVAEAIRGAFQTVIDFFTGIGEFLTDPVGSIKKGLDALNGSFDDTEKNTKTSMNGVKNHVKSAADASMNKLNQLDKTRANPQANATGNAIDGSAGRAVDDTKGKLNSINGKTYTATANVTGNAVNGVATAALQTLINKADEAVRAVNNANNHNVSKTSAGDKMARTTTNNFTLNYSGEDGALNMFNDLAWRMRALDALEA